MRVVLLGNVGGPDAYHAGDEAMLDAAIEQLRCRGDVDITVVSADPADTAERYRVSSVARMEFQRGPGAEAAAWRDRQLDAVLALSRTGTGNADEGAVAAGANWRAVVDAVAGAEALIVTGGGNLSSTWPELLYERVAALAVAAEHGVPSVVTSQTIGPELSARERALLSGALDGARLVGLREEGSLHLVGGLLAPSTPRRLQLDDAVGLPGATAPFLEGNDGFVALTVNPLGDGPEAEASLDHLASLVRRVHKRTGNVVAFLPHLGRWTGRPMGDVAVAEALKERLGGDDELVLCPLLPARQLVALARRAGAIISTRYHPIVFGLAGGVPCLAVYQDHYTSVKLTGALAHAGLSGWSVPLEALATDLPGDVFDELWTRRAELREHLATVTEEWPRAQHDHWDEVWSSLVDPALALPIRPGEARLPRPLEPELAQLATLNAVAAKYMSASEVAESRSREMLLEAEHYAIDLQSALSAKSADLDALHAYLDDVQQDREVAQEGLAVAYTRIDLLHAQLAELDLRRATVEADNIALLDDIRLAEHSAESARTLVAQSRQKVAQLRDEAAQLRDEAARAGQQAARSCEELVAAQSELSAAQIALVSCEARADQQSALIEAIDATKIMRWTRRLRNVYASSRRLLGRGPGR